MGGAHLAFPGSAEEDPAGREGRTSLWMSSLGRETAAGRLGHRQRLVLAPLPAAEEAASMPLRQLLSGSAANSCCPGDEMFPAQLSARSARREARAKSKQREERERQRRRERTREPDRIWLHQ